MPIKDLVTGRSVKIIGRGPTNGKLKVLYDDGTIKVRSRKNLELIEKNFKNSVQDNKTTV